MLNSGYVPPGRSPFTRHPSGPGTIAVCGESLRTVSIILLQFGQPEVVTLRAWVPPPAQKKPAWVTGWQQPMA